MGVIIGITVRNRVATVPQKIAYVCGNSDFMVDFDFDGEWDRHTTKTARFIYNGNYTDVVFQGNRCAIPVISKTINIKVGVFAGDLHTTTPATIMAKKSILCDSGLPADPTPDVYAQIMELLSNQGGIDPDELQNAINTALARAKESGEFDGKPGEKGDPGDGYVLSDDDKAEIAEMASELVEVPESNKNGLSAEASALLIEILRNGVYSADQSANITALATELAVTEPEEPDVPDIPDEPEEPEVTLSSISATYSGGDVSVGTAVTDLTGIVVTAHYSDGSTETVTGYTLSGTIAEGSNTVTVSYGGKTATFTVTGVAENTEKTVELTQANYAWGKSTEYTDGGETAYSGTMGTVTATMWYSDVFEKDTVVKVAVLYGSTNANLRQYCGCISQDQIAGKGDNTYTVHYLEQIGTASTSEYIAPYTVRAGYRLAVINYNSGAPKSIVVTK